MIHWVERLPSSLQEARLTLPDGRDLYVGYVAQTPGREEWRGYVGTDFESVGVGSQSVMRRAVEQRVRELLTSGAIAGSDEGREGERGSCLMTGR